MLHKCYFNIPALQENEYPYKVKFKTEFEGYLGNVNTELVWDIRICDMQGWNCSDGDVPPMLQIKSLIIDGVQVVSSYDAGNGLFSQQVELGYDLLINKDSVYEIELAVSSGWQSPFVGYGHPFIVSFGFSDYKLLTIQEA